MKKEFYVELTEEYNKEGVCVKREIGGVSIPNDEHPSVEFFGEDIKYATSIQTTNSSLQRWLIKYTATKFKTNTL